jgi:hypothetical protein
MWGFKPFEAVVYVPMFNAHRLTRPLSISCARMSAT